MLVSAFLWISASFGFGSRFFFIFIFFKRNGIHKFWGLHSRKSFSLLYTFTGNQSSLYLWSQSPAEVKLDSWLHMAILQPAQYYQNKRTSSQLSICKEQVTLPLPSLYIHPHVFSCLLPHILWLDITPSLCLFIKKKTRWLFIKIKLFSTHVTHVTQLFSTHDTINTFSICFESKAKVTITFSLKSSHIFR